MTTYGIFNNLTRPIDETRPNLFVKETIQSLVQYTKEEGEGAYMLEIERYPSIFTHVDMREDCIFDLS